MAEKHHKNKKPNTALRYLTVPLAYVLISLIIVIPLGLGMLSSAVKAVHKAQKIYTPSVADFVAVDEGYTPSDVKSGTVQLQEPRAFSKVGDLTCSSAGMSVSVYSGSNRASYRAGAGLKTNSAYPGTGGTVEVYAHSTGGFKALYNLKKGDILTFTTSWGVYRYKVTEAGRFASAPKAAGSETLLLATAAEQTAFSAFEQERYVVSAVLTAGPAAEEVTQ